HRAKTVSRVPLVCIFYTYERMITQCPSCNSVRLESMPISKIVCKPIKAMVYQKFPGMLWYTRSFPGCYGIPEDPWDVLLQLHKDVLTIAKNKQQIIRLVQGARTLYLYRHHVTLTYSQEYDMYTPLYRGFLCQKVCFFACFDLVSPLEHI